jgi:hypothetical protein
LRLPWIGTGYREDMFGMRHQRPAGSVLVSLDLTTRAHDARAAIRDARPFRRAADSVVVPPLPKPQPESAVSASVVAAACCLGIGLVAWPATGHLWCALVGLGAAAILLVAPLYHRILSTVLTASPRQRSRLPGVVRRRAPELLIGIGGFGPGLAGVATGVGTGDWRWAITGLAVGAVLPGVALLPMPGVATRILPSAEFAFGAMLLLVGVPGVLLGWMWTADTTILVYGGVITLGGTLLSLCTATLLVARDSS